MSSFLTDTCFYLATIISNDPISLSCTNTLHEGKRNSALFLSSRMLHQQCTHTNAYTNSSAALGAERENLSCNYISLYLGSVWKVKRPEALSSKETTFCFQGAGRGIVTECWEKMRFIKRKYSSYKQEPKWDARCGEKRSQRSQSWTNKL